MILKPMPSLFAREFSKEKYGDKVKIYYGRHRGSPDGSVEKPYLVKKNCVTVIPAKVETHINQRDRFLLPRE
ncbi:MAG: hypothetical protein CO189_07920 [candidate division Zixibacteria bacterium CG_4_9_14_3_um_filter_46_8]|nr:MAG: hypothetical protein CO189_07920 [candidate division Zixibacteria bacterium CG_4_9_14_3_um_filter_46_8]